MLANTHLPHKAPQTHNHHYKINFLHECCVPLHQYGILQLLNLLTQPVNGVNLDLRKHKEVEQEWAEVSRYERRMCLKRYYATPSTTTYSAFTTYRWQRNISARPSQHTDDSTVNNRPHLHPAAALCLAHWPHPRLLQLPLCTLQLALLVLVCWQVCVVGDTGVLGPSLVTTLMHAVSVNEGRAGR